MADKFPKTEGILRDFAEEYDYPYRFMNNDMPPAHQRDKARTLLVEETSQKLQSDGYHTFKELYRYRMLLQAMWFNAMNTWAEAEGDMGLDLHKSWRHSDGEPCFGKNNYFVVVAQLPTGQITNHYSGKYWDLFDIPEKKRAAKWDGHTPEEAAQRMEDYIKSGKLF